MMQKFCMKRQDSMACCGKKGNGECNIKLKYKEWDNYTLALDSLPYGGSCTYKVEAKCGYPALIVNNTNIDMSIAFKKQKWDDDNYEPDLNDFYNDDETSNPKAKNGKIEYKMPKGDKHDDDDKNETKCQKTKMYITLTNLLNPTRTKVTTSRMLEGPSLLTDAVSDNYAQLMFNADEASGYLLSVTVIISAVLSLSSFLF